jgi:hypothetical protein
MCPFDGLDNVACQGSSCGQDHRAGYGGLSDSSTAKHLCGSLAATTRQKVDPLFDPDRDLPETINMP